MTRETISIVTCGFFSPLLLSSDHFARSGGELFSRTQTPNQTQPFASVLFSASESVQNASVIGGAFRTLIIYTLVVRIVSCFCCLQPAAPRRPQRASSPNRFFIRCWRNMTRNFNKYPPQKKKSAPTPPLSKTLLFQTFLETLSWARLASVQGISFLSRHVSFRKSPTPRSPKAPPGRRIQFLFFIVCTDWKIYGRTQRRAAGLPMVLWGALMAFTFIRKPRVWVSGAFVRTRRFYSMWRTTSLRAHRSETRA